MHRILITGGAGFIGANFVRYALAQTDAAICVVDKLTYAGSSLNLVADPRVAFIEADIAHRDMMERTFARVYPTHVVNLAAETHVDRSIDGPAAFVETNSTGTFILLDAARQLAPQCRFLQVSTDEVYGALGATGYFTEQSPYAPTSPYAATKAAGDHLARAYGKTYGLATFVTHCTNNYGPYQHPEKLIPRLITQALAGQPLPVYGDGLQVRDWLHVEDHCAALLAVLLNGEPGETYDVGGSCERTNLTVVEAVCDILARWQPSRDYRALVTHVADRPGHDRRYAIDATKIRTALGWAPRRTFDDGLRETISWYLQHADWSQATRARYDGARLGLGTGAGYTSERAPLQRGVY